MVIDLTNRGYSMSKIMIYATTDKVGGNIENVYGTKMRVRVIDSSDKDEVDQAKADGWKPKADDVIEQIETEKLEAENKVMKGKLDSGRVGDAVNNPRIAELEEQLSTALTEIADFEQERADADKVIDEKIARISELEDEKEVYQVFVNSADADYDKLKVEQLHMLLDLRDKSYKANDRKDTLTKLAKDSE